MEDATLLALKMESRAKEYKWPLEARKGTETDSYLELPSSTWPYQHLDFRTSDRQTCKRIDVYYLGHESLW